MSGIYPFCTNTPLSNHHMPPRNAFEGGSGDTLITSGTVRNRRPGTIGAGRRPRSPSERPPIRCSSSWYPRFFSKTTAMSAPRPKPRDGKIPFVQGISMKRRRSGPTPCTALRISDHGELQATKTSRARGSQVAASPNKRLVLNREIQQYEAFVG